MERCTCTHFLMLFDGSVWDMHPCFSGSTRHKQSYRFSHVFTSTCTFLETLLLGKHPIKRHAYVRETHFPHTHTNKLTCVFKKVCLQKMCVSTRVCAQGAHIQYRRTFAFGRHYSLSYNVVRGFTRPFLERVAASSHVDSPYTCTRIERTCTCNIHVINTFFTE